MEMLRNLFGKIHYVWKMLRNLFGKIHYVWKC